MIYLTLFYEFFKIGLFTFGGGYAMIPLIREIVLNHSWMTETQFYDLIGICESTPGPIAVNMATFVGSTQGNFFGSVFATLGVVLPSFIIILLIVTILNNFTENKYFKGFLRGVKPVVTALIFATGFILLLKCIGYSPTEKFSFNTVSVICFALIFLVYNFVKKVFNKKMSAVMIILMSAVFGITFSLLIK